MRIDDGFQQQMWREPDDGDIVALQRPAPTPASPEEAAPAPEEAQAPFWAAGTPVPPNTLTALPPAAVAAPAPAPPAATGYVGEKPVDAAWLATRESALVAVRQDYEGARAAALASGGNGPGWTTAQLATDESGQVSSLYGRPLVHISDPNAQPVLVGYDEGGPVYQQPAGSWREFDEDAFAAHYRAQGGAALQGLAASYGTDAATLLAQHPGLWTVATQDHAINAGPAPAGRAMGEAGQLGMLDLYMADPQVAGLISSYGGSVPPATSGIAQEQVRVYGQARYEQQTKLGNAMQSVRDQYSSAMADAQANGGPGWTERPRMVTVSDEGGATTTQPLYVTDESGQPLRGADGQPQVLTERVFDPDAFTAWYLQQGGQQHQAFASFYGRSHTQYASDESGRSFASTITFDNPNWSMWGPGGGMAHNELVRIDPNHAPRLNNDSAVGFDLETGWATHHSNIHQKRDWFETVFTVAAVAVVSYFTAGAASGWAAAAGWGTTATAVAAGAAAGAAGSLVSGAMSGNLAFKDILRGALAGGLSGGLMAEFGATAATYGPAGTVALRTTVQGGIQALLGGSFKDGALAGFASGLADVTSGGMQANIDKALASGAMDATQAAAARTFARVLGSAIRAAGSPDNPAAAFASAFLSDVLNEMDPAGFRNPPPVAGGGAEPVPSASQQFNQMRDSLIAQGMSAEQASGQALQQLAQAGADTRTARGYFVPDEHHDAVLAQVRADWAGLGEAAEPDPLPPADTPEVPGDGRPVVTLPPVVVIGQRVTFVDEIARGVGGALGSLYQEGKALAAQGLQIAADGLSLLDVPVLQDYQGRIRDYLDQKAAAGGLSEAEMMVFGALYAANEALFPTNALDFTGGMGKAIGAAAVVLRTGSKLDDVADVVRAESRLLAQATEARVAEVGARARSEGLELVTERAGSKGDWNQTLNGQLKPDALYLLDNGHAYQTDALGRVVKADGALDVNKADRNTWQQAAAGHVGGEGYDGGHLIATLFGGAGEKINLVPQLSTVNRGEFRVMEAEWAKAVLAGQEVKVSVRPVYSGTLGVPDRIVVDSWVNGVRQAPRTFENKVGG